MVCSYYELNLITFMFYCSSFFPSVTKNRKLNFTGLYVINYLLFFYGSLNPFECFFKKNKKSLSAVRKKIENLLFDPLLTKMILSCFSNETYIRYLNKN